MGPLLFTIYINDVCNVLECSKLLFADDLKLYSVIETSDDCGFLQNQLDSFRLWCGENGLAVNVGKCGVVSYTRRVQPILHEYHINESVLPRYSSCKDLGVTFDSRMSFTEHYTGIASAALKTLGFIVRSTKPFTTMEPILLLYFAFVRSRLEYASVIWSPFYRSHIAALEQIQRRLLKYLHYKQYGEYPAQGYSHRLLLAAYDVQALDMRRNQADIKFLYNLLSGVWDAPELLSRLEFIVPRTSTRSHHTFYTATPRTNMMIKSPIYRLCNAYNLMSDDSIDINFSPLATLLGKCTSDMHFS